MEIEKFEHAARLAFHLGRLTGQRFTVGVTARPAEDAAALLEQIDLLAKHNHVQIAEDGQALMAYGRALRVEMDAVLAASKGDA